MKKLLTCASSRKSLISGFSLWKNVWKNTHSSKKVRLKKCYFFREKLINFFCVFYRMDHNIESIDQAQRAQMLTNGEDPSQTIPFFRQTSPIGKKICL